MSNYKYSRVKGKVIVPTVSYLILIFFSILVLIPVLWMVVTALKTPLETMNTPPTWIPKDPSLGSFGRLWQDYPFGSFFRNSVIIVFFSMVVSVFFACLAGYGVSRFKFRGKKFMTTFILITQMFPSVMLLVPFYSVINQLKLINTHLGLIIVYISFTIPFSTWMMIGFFKSLPLELDEAARIDGCTVWQTFWRVVLPLTLPGIASTCIYSFITSWNEYMFAFILTNSPDMRTLSVGIAELNGFQQILWNDMMAASLIASIPLIMLFIFLQKYFISSLTAGAVKG